MELYIITNISDPTLRWSNTDGWTDGEGFDVFTMQGKLYLRLPIDGKWQRLT